MKRIYTSRKLWGAFLASICLMAIVKLTPEAHISSAIMTLGALWGAAIAGQAYGDIVEKKKQIDGSDN